MSSPPGEPAARVPYVHRATVRTAPAADPAALGAAVTVALCGHWEHEPPCPLAPHHTAVEAGEGVLEVRVLFATEPAREAAVRGLIDGALSGDGLLLDSGPGELHPGERAHADRLVRG